MAVKMKKRRKVQREQEERRETGPSMNTAENRKFFTIVAGITVVLLVLIYLAYRNVA